MPYVVMAFQPGETIDLALRRGMPMPVDRAIGILRPLAATLAASAEAGVLHGALHPRDVFVPEDEDGLAGVTGFGIVQALEAAGVATPVLRRPYVAPERTAGAWDARADVFSLGVIAHELFTGRRPAPSGEQDGVFDKTLAPAQRVRLRRVLSTALAEQPDQRFATAADMIAALDEVRGRPVAVPAAPVADPATTTDGALELEGAEEEAEEEQLEQFETPEPEQQVDRLFAALAAGAAAESPSPVNEFLPESPDTLEEPEAMDALDASAGLNEEPEPEDKAPEAPATPLAGLDDVLTPPAMPAVAAAPVVDDWLHNPHAYDVPAAVFEKTRRVSFTKNVKLTRRVFRMGLVTAAGIAVGVAAGLWFVRQQPAAPPTDAASLAAAPSPLADEPAAPSPAPSTPSTPAEPADGDDQSERAEPAPDVRPAVAPGRLVVRSQPSGALVTIDGRRIGETPMVARGLTPGTYDVRVAHPGHVPRNERVTIRAAAPVRTLDVTLTPGLDPIPASSTGAKTTGARGAIDVDSRPRGARVIVDGRFVGLAPLRLSDIGPGDHQVTLELGGYRSATGRIRVDAGRIAELSTTLRAVE